MTELQTELMLHCTSIGNRRIHPGSCIARFYGAKGRVALGELVAKGLLSWEAETEEWAVTETGHATVDKLREVA